MGWQAQAGTSPELLYLPPISSPGPLPFIPSLVVDEGARPLLGQQVLDAGAQGRCQRNFKTQLYKNGTCPEAQQAAAAFLDGIWQKLPPDRIPERLVLTAPVEGFSNYRLWLQQWAATLAVPEVSLVDESTAAALGAGLPPGSLVLVVDMGAGTTDLSLVRLEGGEGRAMPMAQLLRFGGNQLPINRNGIKTARVIGKAGCQVGGRSIDHWWAIALGAPEPVPEYWLEAAEKLKCALSDANSARCTSLRPQLVKPNCCRQPAVNWSRCWRTRVYRYCCKTCWMPSLLLHAGQAKISINLMEFWRWVVAVPCPGCKPG